MEKSLFLLPTLLLAAALTSCGNNGCETVRESYCLVSLQSRSGATITSLGGWGIGQVSDKSNDSITYTDQMFSLSSPTEMELRLNPNDSVTRMLLEMQTSYYGTASQYTDTLTLHYHADPHYLDMECGCTVYFELTSAEVSHSFLQRVTIRDPKVTNETSVNLQLEY